MEKEEGHKNIFGILQQTEDDPYMRYLYFDVCRICHKELQEGVCGNQECIGG